MDPCRDVGICSKSCELGILARLAGMDMVETLSDENAWDQSGYA